MNYENAYELRKKYLYLIDTSLIKSPEYIINDIVVLPNDENTLLAYTGHIVRFYPAWLVTGFDHNFIYKQSGIYILYDGRIMPDNLTLHALLKNKKSHTNVEYKAELLYNLINGQEIEDSGYFPQHLEQLTQIR